MTERTPGQQAAHLALLDYLVRHGELVRAGLEDGRRQSYAGYTETGPWDEHIGEYGGYSITVEADHLTEDCAIDPDRSTYQDSEWDDWQNTEYGWEQQSGLDAVIYCRCGQIEGRHWRWSKSYAELIRGMTG